jgi:hypothetical protein
VISRQADSLLAIGPWRTGELAIFISDADGSREQSLVTSDTLDYNPA